MRNDADLAPLWAATRAPAHDLAFLLAVEARIARRLFLLDLAVRSAATAVILVLVAALTPTLIAHAGALPGQLESAGPVLAAVAILGAAIVRLTWPAAFGGEPEEFGEARS